MKRFRMLFMVSAVTVAMLLASTLPALATSPAGTTVFYPYGNGVTYSCTGGPPFVVDPKSSQANCATQQIGSPPPGAVCDVPTTITFMHDMRPDVENGKLCQ